MVVNGAETWMMSKANEVSLWVFKRNIFKKNIWQSIGWWDVKDKDKPRAWKDCWCWRYCKICLIATFEMAWTCQANAKRNNDIQSRLHTSWGNGWYKKGGRLRKKCLQFFHKDLRKMNIRQDGGRRWMTGTNILYGMLKPSTGYDDSWYKCDNMHIL